MATPSILDAMRSNRTDVGSAPSITIANYAVSAGTNTCLVVAVGAQLTTAHITSVVWGATALASAGYGGSGTDAWAEIFVLKNPTPGTHDIVVTFDGWKNGVAFAVSLQNVDQTTVTRTGAGTNTLNTGAMTTVVGDYVLAVGTQCTAQATVPSGWTDLGQQGAGTLALSDLASLVATGVSTTAAFGGSIGDWHASFGVPFIPAAAVGGIGLIGPGLVGAANLVGRASNLVSGGTY